VTTEPGECQPSTRLHPADVPHDGCAGAQRTRVLYIMGAGRSGSTMLGVVLGNVPGVFYAGELDAWLRRSGAPNFGGRERIAFWERVRRRVRQPESLFGDAAWQAMEHSTSVLGRRAAKRRELAAEYRRIAGELFAAISAESGASWIVDSAHYPRRFAQLRKVPELDLYLIWLVRDPRRVVASFGRRDVDQAPKSALAANAYLWLTHALSYVEFLRHPADRRWAVSYDDFLADPAVGLRAIPPLCVGEGALPDLTNLRTGPVFQGNRFLNAETIQLQRPTTDAPARSWLTVAAQAPWLALFRRLAARQRTRRPAAMERLDG
jgi:hypothetical protein